MLGHSDNVPCTRTISCFGYLWSHFPLIICNVISGLLYNLITVRRISTKLHTFVKHIQTCKGWLLKFADYITWNILRRRSSILKMADQITHARKVFRLIQLFDHKTHGISQTSKKKKIENRFGLFGLFSIAL